MNDPASTDQLWRALATARADQGPRALTAALDVLFRHYLPLARTLVDDLGGGEDPVEPMRAAELGLAQAVLGWRRPDGKGFELFASISIAAQLDRLGGHSSD